MGVGFWLTVYPNTRRQLEHRSWSKIPQHRHVLVAHGAEDVDACQIQKLAPERDEDSNADLTPGVIGSGPGTRLGFGGHVGCITGRDGGAFTVLETVD